MRNWLSKILGRETHKPKVINSAAQREVQELVRLIPKAKLEGPASKSKLGQTLYRIGLDRLSNDLPAQAAVALSAAADLGVNEPYMDYNLALAFSRSGQAEMAHKFFERAFESPHADSAGDGYYLRNMHAVAGTTLDELYKRAGQWAKKYAHKQRRVRAPSTREAKDKLRVGLLSGRFSRHAVGFLTLRGLEETNPERVNFNLYANASPEDDYTARFKALASAWHDITDLDDAKAAELIDSHDLDILIDMAGHSGGGRMGVLALKPAPVQAKWAGGQHGTTGLKALDYFITDFVETPPGDEKYFHEVPARLPHAYACYTPPPDAPSCAAAPFKKNGYVTFGSFNNIAKVSPATIEAWAHILTAVPSSRLILKHLALVEQEVRDRLAAAFSAIGIAPNRLDLRAPTDQATHLAAYADMDIALDPFPWSGCVTTCESLWMGVPVLALPGVAFCHRHSASFLQVVGLEEWIASDIKDYVAKATEFAGQTDRLADLRADLRNRVASSPLCDGPGFAEDFEKLLCNMWSGKIGRGA